MSYTTEVLLNGKFMTINYFIRKQYRYKINYISFQFRNLKKEQNEIKESRRDNKNEAKINEIKIGKEKKSMQS